MAGLDSVTADVAGSFTSLAEVVAESDAAAAADPLLPTDRDSSSIGV